MDERHNTRGLVKGQTVAIDATTLEANAAMRSIERRDNGESYEEFLGRVVAQAREKEWTSDEHFSVDGTLLEAWASVKSFQPKDKKSSSPPDDPAPPR